MRLVSAEATLAEMRLIVRTGTAAVVRVIMARARLACLPVDNPTHKVVQAIVDFRVRNTWWQHSAGVVSQWL